MKREYDVGIIGFGNMGSAIAERIGKCFKNKKIVVFDKDAGRISTVKNADTASGIKEMVSRTDTVILAVKPQDIDGVLAQIKDAGPPPLIISIAAGITTAYIEKRLGSAKIVRAMPNLPAKIGRGMTGLCAGNSNSGGFHRAEDLFYSLGLVLEVEEIMMDAITAVSGSGPAYVCYFLQSNSFDPYRVPWLKKRHFLHEFRSAAEKIGFKKRDAGLLVKTTFSGTVEFLKSDNISAADLIKQVASKGGTTEAALAVLKGGGSLEEAVIEAARRAGELSKN